jgi:hypothetical protein
MIDLDGDNPNERSSADQPTGLHYTIDGELRFAPLADFDPPPAADLIADLMSRFPWLTVEVAASLVG